MSARLTLPMSPEAVMIAKSRFCHTAITTPLAEHRPRLIIEAGLSRLTDAREATANGSSGGGETTSMSFVEWMLTSYLHNRLKPLVMCEQQPVARISAPTSLESVSMSHAAAENATPMDFSPDDMMTYQK